MRIQRTGNAGVLLELDGKRILIDGVCEGYGPYLPTPQWLAKTLLEDNTPGALIYTHRHPDHYDELFVSHYLQKAAGPVLGPADIPYGVGEAMKLGNILVTPVDTRHIGKTDGCMHRSYVLQGSQCIWFLGDASLLDWQKKRDIPAPDVIIAPFGFLMGNGWDYCKKTGVKSIVVVHMPLEENDPYNLWQALRQTITDHTCPAVYIPEIGESVELG